MTVSTTRRAGRQLQRDYSYKFVQMVCCYFLAATTCKASSSMMRRSFFSSSPSIVVEAFVAPEYSTNKNRHRRTQTQTTFHQFTTKTALSSSSSSQATNERTIPRPQNVVQTQTSSTSTSITNTVVDNPPPLLNLHTITLDELRELVVSWGYPKFRGKQIYGWIRDKGVTNPNDMNNLPKDLRNTMLQFTSRSNSNSNTNNSNTNSNDTNTYADSQVNDNGGGALSLAFEAVSKDGTIKRAYQLRDGQLIESVLMGPYEDGRYTACISSQAGCAMGCVFCATGQMGFARQLSADEILEQVSRFSSELKRGNDPSKRLSNIVFMGMGEPLANYRNVVKAVNRINSELGIGARRITVSTVGVVPSIRKLYAPDTEMPQVRLAVSLHCADDAERTKLLPANERYGGLHELMVTLGEYIDTTGRRITLEWALIAHQNDGTDTARQLGNLVRKYGLRRDMIHVNVIPLNPTQGFEGAKPSNVKRVNAFCDCLKNEFGISATPRVRRGIDIDAGCGQLKAKIQKREQKKEQQQQHETVAVGVDTATLADFIPEPSSLSTVIGVYDDYGNDNDDDDEEQQQLQQPLPLPTNQKIHQPKQVVEFTLADDAVDFEFDDFENPEYEADSHDMAEALRLVAMVEKGAFATATSTTTSAATTPSTSSSSTVGVKVVDDDSSSPVKGPTTTIVDADAVRDAKKKRKKLLRNLKQIQKLKDMKASGALTALSKEQLEKIGKEEAWRNEVEDLEHNLKS